MRSTPPCCAANKWRHYLYILRLDAEHAADITLDVLHALRLVVDRKFAVTAIDHRRCIELHWVVMLDRCVVIRLVTPRRGDERLFRRAARLRWGEQGLEITCRRFDRNG